MHRTIHRSLPLLAVGLVAALLGGCADGGAADAADTAADGAPETVAAEADDVVEVRMVDFGYDGLPDSVAAGTRLTVVNDAESELHEVVAFALPDDEQRPVSELTDLAPGELIQALGEPVTVLLAAPGGDQIPAVGDGTLDEPGRYAIMCFIPTGADVQEYLEAAADPEHEGPPQVEGGPPHFVHGMFAELLVE